MRKCYVFCLMFSGFALISTNLLAATYKYTDKDGNVVYSSTPPTDGKSYEKIKGGAPSYGTDEPAAAPSGAATTGSSSKSDDLIKKEQAKNSKLRQENCEGAKKNLEAYTVYRRIQDKDGKVMILDDAERQKKIDEAKTAIKEFCD